jgi:TPR repeat protein
MRVVVCIVLALDLRGDALRVRCWARDAAACFEVGSELYDAADYAGAMSYLRRGCDGGEPHACAREADLRYHGLGTPRDVQYALVLYSNACEKKIADACAGVGNVLVDEGHPKDALAWYLAACDGGAAWGCDGAGDLLYYGRGVGADLPRAASLYDRACTGGLEWGCNGAGNVAFSRGDLPRALVLYDGACDRGVAWACASEAHLVDDPKRAAELKARACDGGDRDACP